MRNLVEYPITREEVSQFLNDIPETDAIGGNTNFIRARLIEHLEEPEMMKEFLKKLDVTRKVKVDEDLTKLDIIVLVAMTAFVWWTCKYGWILFYAGWVQLFG